MDRGETHGTPHDTSGLFLSNRSEGGEPLPSFMYSLVTPLVFSGQSQSSDQTESINESINPGAFQSECLKTLFMILKLTR